MPRTKEKTTMLKVLVFVLTTIFFVGCTAPTTERQTNAAASPTATTAPKTATSTPPATSSPSAPTTAKVKNVGLKWQDEASGTPVTTIKVGGTVTWTTTPGPPHSLKREAPSSENGCQELDASFDTPGNITPGQPVTRTFDKVGVYGYHCGIHGGKANCTAPPGDGQMPGVIKVVP